VETIVREVLDSKGINYHSITSRAKPIESYREKASKEQYKDPRSEIMDMAGIRVVTYIDADAQKAAEIVEGLFEIIPEHTVDKTRELGTDRVGYRSIHCVGTLGKKRVELPENKNFSNLCFEVQIRTILQHAWAEFEHDRNYKFKGILPNDLRRRFAIVAGSLELADREFDSISHAVDDYTSEVQERAQLGDLSAPINSASLMVYMGKRFEESVKRGLKPEIKDDAVVIGELLLMGIDTLKKLDEVIPNDIAEMRIECGIRSNFTALLRHIMIIKDADAYFRDAWRNSWQYTDKVAEAFLRHYGVDVDKYFKRYNIRVE
jgi:ppGpp synthetase/RelA/SpoT-type nucleotidyltranferase